MFQNKQVRNEPHIQIKQKPENEDDTVEEKHIINTTESIEGDITFLSTLSHGINIKKKKGEESFVDNAKKKLRLEQEKVYKNTNRFYSLISHIVLD